MIILLLVLAVVLYYVEKYSLEHGLDQVTFETSTDRVIVEPEEPFTWVMTIKNGKRLMVPYLKLKESVPHGLSFSETGEPVEQKGISGHHSTLYLAGRQQVILERKVCLPDRGRYFFRGSSVDAGDFLGLTTTTETYSELKEMVVKPRPFPDAAVTDILGGFLGEQSVRKSLMEDPVITIGFREYTGREPFRSISWTQSAKNNRLLVKQFDCTADFSCTILLNTEFGSEVQPALLETCFSVVRTVCEELERKKISYDFCTNGVIAGAMGSWEKVGEGLGTGHLEAVLEGLGRMTFDHRETAGEFLDKTIRGVRAGRTFLLVTPELSETIYKEIGRLETVSGQKVLVFCGVELVQDKQNEKDGESDREERLEGEENAAWQ